MKFAKINGINLHYQVTGNADGRPVLVFANSLGTDFRIWDDVIAQLGDDYCMIAYDKRGHGLSDAPLPPYEMKDHVNDLAGLLDFLKVSKAHVCGVSVGGMIAQGLCLQRPELVASLILCDTGHKIGTAESWNKRISDVEEFGIEAISDVIMERWFSKSYRDPQNPAYACYENMLVRTPKRGYVGTCHALRDADYTRQLANVDVSSLCVVGNEDASTPPELVRELSELIGGEFIVIEGVGHLPCIENPVVLSNHIKRFLMQETDR